MTEDEIKVICKKYNIHDYHINKDGTIDVDGAVTLSNKQLYKLPLKFGRINNGGFYCYGNNLKSLEGAPTHVDTHFYCSDNKLTSLNYAPDYVGGNFTCYHNPDLNDYSPLLTKNINGEIHINLTRIPIAMQDILIMELNKILIPYDLIVIKILEDDYVIKNVINDAVIIASTGKTIQQDVMSLIN